MNMKKLIASVIAGAVAVSAMATSAFATETSKTYTLMSSTYKATYSQTVTSTDLAAAVTGVAGNIVLTFEDVAGAAGVAYNDVASVSAQLTLVKLAAALPATAADTTRTLDVVFKNTTAAPNVYTLVVVNSGVVSDGSAVILATESITKAVLTVKTKSITATSATDKSEKFVVTGTTTLGGSAGALGLAVDTALDAAGTPAQSAPSVTAAGEYDFVTNFGLSTNYVANVNNFFDDGSNGRIILDLEAVAATATSTAPTNNVTLGTISAKDFGLAANRAVNNKLVSAKDAVDGKVTFSVDELTASMGADFTGNIDSLTLVVGTSALANLNAKEIKIKSITYVKDDAAAVTEATTEATTAATTAAAATDTTNPGTGAAPVALALIPAALAAVVVAKKRK